MADELVISYWDIEAATDRLRGIVRHTPVVVSHYMNEIADAEIFFKCENFQHAGAFKFRGAYNAMASLADDARKRGVVAYSSGNHAQAMAKAGQMLGVPVTIVMPYDAPAIKIAATRGYGAEVILYDRHHEDREVIANSYMTYRGLTLIPPFDHPHVIAGQGTAAKELFGGVGNLDYLFVPIGGGGLISGSAIAASHLSPSCRMVGVEPEAGNDVEQSFRQGRIVTIPVPKTIADGAQTTSVGKLTFPIIQKLVHDIVTVSDDQLRGQMRQFSEYMKMIVEPTGCLAAAAVLNHKINVTGKRVGVIVSGGNVDLDLI